MKIFDLEGKLRTETGKKANKALRLEGSIPCVVYGGKENIMFSVIEKDLKKLLFTPLVHIVKLNVEGKVCDAVMREVQYHPVSDRPLHIDFYEIPNDKPVVMEVPVKLNGFAEGVKAGGVMNLILRKLKVKALPNEMPGEIDIDVTKLTIGKTIKVKELSFDKYEIVNGKEVVICQIKLTRAAKSTDVDATATTPVVPAAATPTE